MPEIAVRLSIFCNPFGQGANIAVSSKNLLRMTSVRFQKPLRFLANLGMLFLGYGDILEPT